MPMGYERPQLGDRLVPSAEYDCLPVLDFFEIMRQMGLCIMDVYLLHD